MGSDAFDILSLIPGIISIDDRNLIFAEEFPAPAYPLITEVKLTLNLSLHVTSIESPTPGPLDYTASINTNWSLTTRNYEMGNEFGAAEYDAGAGAISSGEFCLFWQALKPWERKAMWTLHAYKTFQFAVSGVDNAGASISGGTNWDGFILVQGLYREDDSNAMRHVPYEKEAGTRLVEGDSDAKLRLVIGVSPPDPPPAYSVPGEIGGLTTQAWEGDDTDMPVVPSAENWRTGSSSTAFSRSRDIDYVSPGTAPYEDFRVTWDLTNFVAEFVV